MLEIFPNHAHARDQSLIQNLLRGPPLGEGFFCEPLHLVGVPLVQELIHQGIIRHPSSAQRLLEIATAARFALNSSSASSMARIFSRGIPGLVPPPTERMIPSPPEPSSTSRVSSLTSSGVPRTPISSGFTLPIRHMRSPTRRFTSVMCFCLPQLSTLNPASGKWSRHASTSASLWYTLTQSFGKASQMRFR